MLRRKPSSSAPLPASPRKKVRPKLQVPQSSDLDVAHFGLERNALEKQLECKRLEQAELAMLEKQLHGKSNRELGAMHIEVIEELFNCQEKLEQWTRAFETNHGRGVKNRCRLTRGAGPQMSHREPETDRSMYEAERAEGRVLHAALRSAETMRLLLSRKLGLDDAEALEHDILKPKVKWPLASTESVPKSVPLAIISNPPESTKPKFSLPTMSSIGASLYGAGRGSRSGGGSTAAIGVSFEKMEAQAAPQRDKENDDATQCASADFVEFTESAASIASPAAVEVTYATEAFTTERASDAQPPSQPASQAAPRHFVGVPSLQLQLPSQPPEVTRDPAPTPPSGGAPSASSKSAADELETLRELIAEIPAEIPASYRLPPASYHAPAAQAPTHQNLRASAAQRLPEPIRSPKESESGSESVASEEATGAAGSGRASPSTTGRYTPPAGLTIQLPSEAVQELDALRALFKKPADTIRHPSHSVDDSTLCSTERVLTFTSSPLRARTQGHTRVRLDPLQRMLLGLSHARSSRPHARTLWCSDSGVPPSPKQDQAQVRA